MYITGKEGEHYPIRIYKDTAQPDEGEQFALTSSLSPSDPSIDIIRPIERKQTEKETRPKHHFPERPSLPENRAVIACEGGVDTFTVHFAGSEDISVKAYIGGMFIYDESDGTDSEKMALGIVPRMHSPTLKRLHSQIDKIFETTAEPERALELVSNINSSSVMFTLRAGELQILLGDELVNVLYLDSSGEIAERIPGVTEEPERKSPARTWTAEAILNGQTLGTEFKCYPAQDANLEVISTTHFSLPVLKDLMTNWDTLLKDLAPAKLKTMVELAIESSVDFRRRNSELDGGVRQKVPVLV